MGQKEQEEETFRLTPWGMMTVVCRDYNIDVSHMTPKMGEHMISDFMDMLMKAGYVEGNNHERG